ncbi:MAG: hypothetical protein QXT19_01135 [Candidatus Woesearchaeota archaeon]
MPTMTESETGIAIVRNFLTAALLKAKDFERQPNIANKDELLKTISAALAAAKQLKIPPPV